MSGSVPAAPPAQTNWLTEWQHRTPVVSRWITYIILPVTIFGWIAGSEWMAVDVNTFLSGHVWRLLTSLPYQGGALVLLFVMLMMMMQGPAQEAKLGSLRFLVQLLTFGLLINTTYAFILVSVCG